MHTGENTLQIGALDSSFYSPHLIREANKREASCRGRHSSVPRYVEFCENQHFELLWATSAHS